MRMMKNFQGIASSFSSEKEFSIHIPSSSGGHQNNEDNTYGHDNHSDDHAQFGHIPSISVILKGFAFTFVIPLFISIIQLTTLNTLFHVCCKIVFRRGCSFTLAFHQCVFSSVSSNEQLERLHNHTGCICLAFLHYVFSDVSPNCMPERMQSRTACICLTFLHYAFSDVFPNCLN